MKTTKKTAVPEKKPAKGKKLKSANAPRENSSPVCYLDSDEVRDEFK